MKEASDTVREQGLREPADDRTGRSIEWEELEISYVQRTHGKAGHMKAERRLAIR